jgi:hypothetical protein
VKKKSKGKTVKEKFEKSKSRKRGFTPNPGGPPTGRM